MQTGPKQPTQQGVGDKPANYSVQGHLPRSSAPPTHPSVTSSAGAASLGGRRVTATPQHARGGMQGGDVAQTLGKHHMFKGRTASKGGAGGFRVPRRAPSDDDSTPGAGSDGDQPEPASAFVTARSMAGPEYQGRASEGGGGKSLGGKRRAGGGVGGGSSRGSKAPRTTSGGGAAAGGGSGDGDTPQYWWMPEDGEMPDELSGLDPEMVDRIMNEVLDSGDPTTFDDIAGLAHVKQTMIEVVVWPILNPQLFSGLRALPKGLLLFGPPGTGKTLIGKAVAAQCGATFFSVSASSLTSKWIGEGERMVRTMFAAARWRQPAVVFIDEIDSLLTARSDNENEASRRIKTEFLVQMDGAGTRSDDRVLVIGATNRPGELDEAARRRFVKRLYVPLPEAESRQALVQRLMSKQGAKHALSAADVAEIVRRTAGYSGADMTQLCQAAAWAPLRELASHVTDITAVQADSIRAINLKDFKRALKAQGPSVAQSELARYVAFDSEFGMAAQAAGADSDDSD